MKISLLNTKPLGQFVLGFILFLTAILTSSLFAYVPAQSIKAFIKWAEVLVLSLLIFFYIRNHISFRFVYWLLFISALGYPIISFYFLVSGRLADTGFRLPNPYDALFALCLIIPFIKRRSLSFLLLGIFLTIMVFLSFSRGAWLALAALTFYLALHFYKQNKRLTIISIAAMILFVVAISSDYLTALVNWRWHSSFDPEMASNIERAGMIRIALKAFLSNPLFGIGALNFSTYLLNTGDLYILRSEVLETLTPHNFFLEILCELGLFGFIALMMVFISVHFALKFQSPGRGLKIEKCYQEGLYLLFATFLFAIALTFIAGAYRFYLSLLCGLALSFTKAQENKSCLERK